MIQLTDIYKPIFIVGSPRSGTTMIYDFLAGHKDVAWFSQLDFTENYSQEYRRFLDLRRRIFSVRKWHYFPEGNETRLRTTFEIPDEFGNFWNKWIGKEGWADDTDANPKVIQNLDMQFDVIMLKKIKDKIYSKFIIDEEINQIIKKLSNYVLSEDKNRLKIFDMGQVYGFKN